MAHPLNALVPIDVTPSGNKLSAREYKTVMKQVGFELGAIAYHCKEIYLKNPNYYDDYAPISMMSASNDFYNFIIDAYPVFRREDGITLSAAWEMYKNYCDEAKVSYPFPKRNFKEELKNYFDNFDDRFNTEDGSRIRSYYSGFRTDKFELFFRSGTIIFLNLYSLTVPSRYLIRNGRIVVPNMHHLKARLCRDGMR